MYNHLRNIEPEDYADLADEIEDTLAPRRYKRKRVKRERVQVITQLAQAGDDSALVFNPTYFGSKHEHAWILKYLGPFYENHLLSDVLHQVKGGKEANVYCCRAYPTMGVNLVAAKVYRPRMFRNLRNDALYRKGRETIGDEGKQVRGRRDKLAMRKKTDYGQRLRHTTWLANEYEYLEKLAAAGADVPKPLAMNENAILMEYVGEKSKPAPTLHETRLDQVEANTLFERLIRNIGLFLAHDCIHADLSAYNVLYREGEIKIIDLPQAVNPYKNPEAQSLLQRDVERVCDYFARYGIRTDPRQLAQALWDRHVMHQQMI